MDYTCLLYTSNEEDAELCLGFKPEANVEAGETNAEMCIRDRNFIFSGELYFFLELNILCKCLYTSCLYLFEIKMKIMS